jgi:hypothetical protein
MRRTLETLAWTAAFALSYAQSPLYTSNQNQYFLHGFARAGVGFLRDDWLANTADPTPLFSAMASALASTPWVFYLIYAGLMGVYLFSLLSIAGRVVDLSAPARRKLALAALIVLHSAALRYALARLISPDAEFLLEGGVAGQRLLGAVLQPSAFGVFLVLSLALFLGRRPIGATLALTTAAAVHPTYLLSSAILLAIYVAILARDPASRPAAASTGWIGGMLLGTIAVAVFLAFRPTGADLYAIASDILVRSRIPHHAIPAKWLDATVGVQLALVAGAAWIARRTPVFVVLLAGSLTIAVLTAAQILTGSQALALVFPWRLSTVLVPVSSAVWVCATVGWLVDRFQARPSWYRLATPASVAVVVLASLAGVYRFQVEVGQQRQDPAAAMMAFVARSAAPGEVYLIDPKLQDFRLRTGTPIVVDAKAIPYVDREVVEWWERLQMARNFYRDRPEWVDCDGVDDARVEYGATHVVLGPEQLGVECPQLEERYTDGQYAVYRIRSEG